MFNLPAAIPSPYENKELFLSELMKYTANLLNKKTISFEELKIHYIQLQNIKDGDYISPDLLNTIYDPFEDSLSEDSTF